MQDAKGIYEDLKDKLIQNGHRLDPHGRANHKCQNCHLVRSKKHVWFWTQHPYIPKPIASHVCRKRKAATYKPHVQLERASAQPAPASSHVVMSHVSNKHHCTHVQQIGPQGKLLLSLQSLLELHELGEKVIWPKGYCPTSAAEYIHKSALHDMEQVLPVCGTEAYVARHVIVQAPNLSHNVFNHPPASSTPRWSNPSAVVASSSRPGDPTIEDGEGQVLAIEVAGRAASHAVVHSNTAAITQVCIVGERRTFQDSQLYHSTVYNPSAVVNTVDHPLADSTPLWPDSAEVVASVSRPGDPTTKAGEGQVLATSVAGQADMQSGIHACSVGDTQGCTFEPHVGSLQNHVSQLATGTPRVSPKTPCCLDDPDGFECQEDSDLEPAPQEPWPEQELLSPTDCGNAASSADPNPMQPHVGPPATLRKRLFCKTNAACTAYAHIRPLGTKAEQRARKRKIQEILRANSERSKRAKVAAQSSLIANIEAISLQVDGKDEACAEYDVSYSEQMHMSHSMKPVHGHIHAAYCDNCGAWNNGGSIRSLKHPCSGKVSKYRQFQHRLLRLGIIPNKGARTPAHAKLRFAR